MKISATDIIMNSKRLSTIDLFSGAGGITEGFRQAYFDCLYANDNMIEAIHTFSYNHKNTTADERSIEIIDPRKVRNKLELKPGELDVLVGGPPCQGFSINAPERFLDDPRNKLFKHYERFVEEFQPKTFLFENVPGLLSLGDGKVYRQVINIFSNLGYHISSKILFAAHYGVPQERWRLIILGSRYKEITHPEPTHYAKGVANFRGGRDMIYHLTVSDKKYLLPCTNIRDAIDDLPKLKMGEGAEEIKYDRPCNSAYAQQLRNDKGVTYNHFATKLSKQNIERMRYIKPGGSWRDIPIHLLPEGMRKARKSDHTKRYGRLRFDGLSGTVLTKCDPHWGAVLLPDQDRVLTVREAARLQSFPDHYKFLGSRVSQYKQVGNAVPVLLAKAIAVRLRDHIMQNATCKKGEYSYVK